MISSFKKFIFKNSLHNIKKLSPFIFFSNTNNCCDDPTHNHKHSTLESQNKLDIKSTISNKFDEKTAIPTFINYFKENNAKKNDEDIKNFLNYLEKNLKEIKKPNSCVAIIDKLKYITKSKELEDFYKKCLNHSIDIFEMNYHAVTDKGDLLKAIILVASLMKTNKNQIFYEKMMILVLKNINNISIKNLFTISESYIYNKLIITADLNWLLIIFERFIKLKQTEIDIFSKLIQIIRYILKNKEIIDAKNIEGQFNTELIEIFQKIIKNIYNNLLILILNIKPGFDILILAEIMNYLEILHPFLNDRDLIIIHNKFTENYNNYIEKTIGKNIDCLTNDQIMNFINKFFNVKPVNLHQKILESISNNFKKINFDKLKDLTIYLYFLSKNSNNFIIPKKTHMELKELINKEKNILILAKLMETFTSSYIIKSDNSKESNLYLELQDENLNMLEIQFFKICINYSQISLPLLIFSQGLGMLNKGKVENWIFIFEYFSDKDKLKSLDFIELFIKLIPTAGYKTKIIFKLLNPVLKPQKSNWQLNSLKGGDELTNSIEKFWTNLENYLIENLNNFYFDKYSLILTNFVYANLKNKKYTKIFIEIKNLIIENFLKLSIKQICDIAYSYARISQRFDEFFFMIYNKNIEIKVYENESDLINLYWSFALMRIEDKSCFEIIEKRIIKSMNKLNQESITQFIQAYSINNKKNNEFIQVFNQNLYNHLDLGNEINLFNIFQQCYSFLILENYDEKIWKKILQFIIISHESFISNKIFINYLYLIFIHLKYQFKNNDIILGELNKIEQILKIEKHHLINYFVSEKLSYSSQYEVKFINIVKNNLEKIVKNNTDKSNFLYLNTDNKNNKKLLLCDNFSILNEEYYIANFFEEFFIIPYIPDLRIENNTILEYNGRVHYMYDKNNNKYDLDGVSYLKKKFLECVGLKIIEIPFHIIGEKFEENEIIEIIQNKI